MPHGDTVHDVAVVVAEYSFLNIAGARCGSQNPNKGNSGETVTTDSGSWGLIVTMPNTKGTHDGARTLDLR